MEKEKKIYIGSDHAGFKLKEKIKKFLVKENYKVEDLGAHKYDCNDDYPDYALKVCKKVLKTGGKGILICGAGQGVSIVANKIPGIRAALCWNKNSAKLSKEHLNANVLCLGQRTLKLEFVNKIVKFWLETPFISKGRHIRRINKIKAVERKFWKSPRDIKKWKI